MLAKMDCDGSRKWQEVRLGYLPAENIFYYVLFFHF